MKKSILLLLLLLPVHAGAVPLLLEATSLTDSFGDFTVLFDDTGDGLLQAMEITDFSGVDGPIMSYDLIIEVPDIAAIATYSPTSIGPCLIGNSGENWCFGRLGVGLSVIAGDASNWEYRISGRSSVPEPAALGLIGIGLIVLGFRKRKA